MTSQTLSGRIRAPEDIQVGDHIAVSQKRYQLLPDVVETSVTGREVEPLTVTLIPFNAGEPMKVVGLSLPFVMCKLPNGDREAIDTRRHALVRVGKAYASAAQSPTDKKREAKTKRKRKGKHKKKRKKK